MKLDYQTKLEEWLTDIPQIPGEIVSGSPMLPPYSPELKERLENPALEAALNAEFPTNKLFQKYTGTTQVTLMNNWAGGGKLTTCNSFVGTAGRIMGAKDFLGQFELKEFLTKSGKGYAWVDASSGRRPNYGDIFRPESFHMGVSLGFDGDNWLTVEAGQGGRGRGCDAVKRKQQSYSPVSLKGWCDMRLYLSEKPPMPDWMVGTWVVYCGSETHHYQINPYAEAIYYPFKPFGNTGNEIATDTGKISMQGADNFTILWSKKGGIEKFKYERFDSFLGIMEKISGFSNRNEPMRGVRL